MRDLRRVAVLASALALGTLGGGCASPEAPLLPAAPVWVESRKVAAGQPIVLHAPADSVFPPVEGLTFTQAATTDDGQAVWEVRGANGSYILPFPEGKTPDGKAPDGSAVPGPKLYVDIGVDGPSGGPMEDLAGLPKPEPARWPYALAAAVCATLFTGGLLALWRKYRPKAPPPPPEPADLVARRAWAAARGRTDLTPEALAYELSGIYRRYLEAAHTWPATSRTTREILDNLSGELTAAELDASRRLLSAMDLVKFADREMHAGLFESLDKDFERVCKPVVRSDLPPLPMPGDRSRSTR